jgi:hypothetical protein
MATSWMNSGTGNTKGWLNAGMGQPNPGGQQISPNAWNNAGTQYTYAGGPMGTGLQAVRRGDASSQYKDPFPVRQQIDPYASLMAALGAQPSYNIGSKPADVPVGPVFSQADTDQATGGIMANAQQEANIPYLLKQFARPGVSQGSGQLSAAIPLSVGAMSRGIGAAQNLALSNDVLNENSYFARESANAQRDLGWGNVQSGLDTLGRNQRYFNQNQLLQQLFG